MVAFALKRCYITVAGDLGPTRKYEQLKGWITTAGGKLSKTITIDTTHLVCTEKQWKAQIELVRKALEIKDQQPIKIVHEDWLEHSLMQTTKKKEGVYLWEKIDKASMTAKKQAEKLAKRAENETKEKRPPGGILGEALKQHTDDLLGVKEREKIERQRKKDKEREIYAREEERQAKRKLSKEAHAAIYKKGAKKARNEIFSGMDVFVVYDQRHLLIMYREPPCLRRQHWLQVRHYPHQSQHPSQQERAPHPYGE